MAHEELKRLDGADSWVTRGNMADSQVWNQWRLPTAEELA